MNNGSLKSLLLLWENLAQNQRYSPYVEKMDITTFHTRATNEGLTFLTQVLPLIGKALDRYHSTFEWAAPEHFVSFERIVNIERDLNESPAVLSIPLFLGYAISCALEGDSVAVDCVRQLSFIFYKYEVPHDDRTVERFLEKFRQTDSGLSCFSDNEANHASLSLIAKMKVLISRVLCNTDPRIITPSHGGGATACRTENKDKYHTLRYFPELDEVYPYDDLFFYSPTHLIDAIKRLEDAPLGVRQARVCLVPKDSRGPRVISCEPAELMFVQQGLMKLLYEVIETHYLTAGQVNFTDQTINRELARQGSITDEYSTIDLSDASDRVSLRLVELVFPERWVECFKACRSDTTLLPDKSVVKLNKFAPMGSACCFPVEALVFWACAEASTIGVPGYESRSTFVYGDDIIIRSDLFERVTEGLQLIDLLVNKDKSYRVGPFRESCGGDYHIGYEVTPIRIRKALSSHGTGFVRNADLANLFIAKYGWNDAAPLVEIIEEAIGTVYPRTLLPIPCTVRKDPDVHNDVNFSRRFNRELQRIEYRVPSLSMSTINAHLPDWEELHRMELTKHSPDRMDILLGRNNSFGDEGIRYENITKVIDSKLRPGQYADPHSARTKWVWTWLG